MAKQGASALSCSLTATVPACRYPTAGSAETTLRQRHSPGNSPGRISPVGSGSPRSGSPVANPSGKLKLTKAQAAPVEAPIYQRPPPPAAGSGSPPRERSPRERSPRERCALYNRRAIELVMDTAVSGAHILVHLST